MYLLAILSIYIAGYLYTAKHLYKIQIAEHKKTFRRLKMDNDDKVFFAFGAFLFSTLWPLIIIFYFPYKWITKEDPEVPEEKRYGRPKQGENR